VYDNLYFFLIWGDFQLGRSEHHKIAQNSMLGFTIVCLLQCLWQSNPDGRRFSSMGGTRPGKRRRRREAEGEEGIRENGGVCLCRSKWCRGPHTPWKFGNPCARQEARRDCFSSWKKQIFENFVASPYSSLNMNGAHRLDEF